MQSYKKLPFPGNKHRLFYTLIPDLRNLPMPFAHHAKIYPFTDALLIFFKNFVKFSPYKRIFN